MSTSNLAHNFLEIELNPPNSFVEMYFNLWMNVWYRVNLESDEDFVCLCMSVKILMYEMLCVWMFVVLVSWFVWVISHPRSYVGKK